ncbi:MAG: DNA methyltransferase [Myroides sp.]
MQISDKIVVTNEDNMKLMARYPDGHFDLAIVDPPYGIGEADEKRMQSRHHSQRKYKGGSWDSVAPDKEYFSELFRVSKNQIIWGANHFISKMPKDASCWIFWDKDGYGDFADGELAWSSFPTAVRKFKFTWNGFRKQEPQDRIHPTEKPFALYKWLLQKYAKQGDKILDTHLGSGSIAIACFDFGFDLTACELDEDYYNDSIKRIKNHVANNQSLFAPEELLSQPTLFE